MESSDITVERMLQIITLGCRQNYLSGVIDLELSYFNPSVSS